MISTCSLVEVSYIEYIYRSYRQRF